MARTPLGITGSSKAGEPVLPPVAANITDGNSVNNNGETVLTVTNAGAVTRTLSIPLAVTVDGQPVGPRVYSIPAGQTILAGPYPPGWYGTTLLLDASSGDLMLSAFRLGTGLPAPAGAAAAFTAAGPAVLADLDFAGLLADNNILVVDTALTGSTLDGNVLVVTV
ncbi:hypothetical protein Ade02nite_19690 [Paractinoplanes deccanensis]|uniref:Uncharacterized protein n=1 Tax=Paractinoplanes deccanensis TaxID=113561 RepID=A0ABQ3Y003_9ACTN|nr:hypothetical protein [Actinoplanes deccanensis]GID73328.1 hypothetical protein Ade02nite_19690 [Actinoplanes deccanensis]